MKERNYVDEGMDVKKYILCVLGRLWLIIGMAAAGAALGALIYTAVRTVPASEREYQAFAKLYLDFAADETGEVYQAYNGYTWNDLMAADPIMNLVLKNLPADYDREAVAASMKAEILSDIRLLTLTVTTNTPERTDEILAAAAAALTEYGTQAKEFLAVNAIQVTQAKLLVADNRLLQAVLTGLCLGLLFAFFSISLYYVMDDRILVPGDVRKVTDLSFLGYCFSSENAAQGAYGEKEAVGGAMSEKDDLRANLQEDYKRSLAYLQEKTGTVYVCEVEPGKPFTAEDFEKMRNISGVVLSLPFGRMRGTVLSYVIEQLKTQDCVLCGVAIRDADTKFMQRYYGKAFGERQGKDR